MAYRQTTVVHLHDGDTLAIERDRTGLIGATVRDVTGNTVARVEFIGRLDQLDGVALPAAEERARGGGAVILRRRPRRRSKLVIYRTESTNPKEAYGFRVIAGNGEQIGRGEGYITARDAVRGGCDLISGRHAGAEVVMPS